MTEELAATGPTAADTASPTTEPAAGVPPAGADSGRAVARHSAQMATGSMLGRATGLVRTVAIGAAIGGATFANNYALANNLPNMVYELLLGGVLAAAVVPMLVRARADEADGGVAYAQRLLSGATVALAVATVLAVACAPLLTRVIATGANAADRRVITLLGYLLLPEIFFYGLAALLGAVLNSRGRFAAPMWAPILNNVVVTATAAAFVLVPTVARPPDPETATVMQIAVLGVGTTLGIIAQATALWPALRRDGFRWRWRWDLRALHPRQLGRIGAWTLVYVVVNQVAVVVVLNIANHARQPGPAIYNNAYLMVMMVYGVVAVSITTALLPRMAAASHTRRHDDLAGLVAFGIRVSLVILVPAAVAYLVLGRPIAVSLFEFGDFTHRDAVQTGWIITVGAFTLIPFGLNQLQVFTFYAMTDTRTPGLANIPVAAIRIGIDLALYAVLPSVWVAAGLMAGNAVSFLVGLFLYAALLRRRLGRLPLRPVLDTGWRLAVAGLAAAAVTLLALLAMQAATGTGKAASIAQTVVCGALLVATYLAVAYALGTPDLRRIVPAVWARLGGGAGRGR